MGWGEADGAGTRRMGTDAAHAAANGAVAGAGVARWRFTMGCSTRPFGESVLRPSDRILCRTSGSQHSGLEGEAASP